MAAKEIQFYIYHHCLNITNTHNTNFFLSKKKKVWIFCNITGVLTLGMFALYRARAPLTKNTLKNEQSLFLDEIHSPA